MDTVYLKWAKVERVKSGDGGTIIMLPKLRDST